MKTIYHALVLNLHQPAGNLEHLLEHNEWEARELLLALDRMPRLLWQYENIARVHLSLSGTLLETLSDPNFQSLVYGIVDCGSFIWHLQNQKLFDILGTAYYHPVLPLIPEADHEEHLSRWQGIARHLFWRPEFPGFWPPEMGFSMELIPLIKRLGYQYVLVDSNHVEPVGAMSWEEIRYRPHIARYNDEELIVVVRDRELSDAQESGMDFGWFYHDLHQRTKWCYFEPLITTCTDGDNGGWFRNIEDKGNYWGYFYPEYMERIRSGESRARPIFIHDYLARFGAHGEVTVKDGAWNTGWHHGEGFTQWTGSQPQKDGMARVHEASKAVHELLAISRESDAKDPALEQELENSLWRLLQAETSCNFYWGEAWVPKSHKDLDAVWAHLERARKLLAQPAYKPQAVSN